MKLRIRQSQIKAAVKVNTELLRLYWQMGSEIVEKQKNAHWGDGFLKQLSNDLMSDFPDMKGFSYRNLRAIKQWFLFYYESFIKWQQAAAILEDTFLSIPWGAPSLDNATLQRHQQGHFLHTAEWTIENAPVPIGISKYELQNLVKDI